MYRDAIDIPSGGPHDFFPKHIKIEENSSDDYNINDYLETSVNAESPDAGGMDMYASSSSSVMDQMANESFFCGLSKKQVQTLQSQQVWINSKAKSSSNLRDAESSSPSYSQRSEVDVKPNHNESRSMGNSNRYQSFGMYIADTLNRMDEKYANELHISILQEIIKVQTKVSRDS